MASGRKKGTQQLFVSIMRLQEASEVLNGKIIVIEFLLLRSCLHFGVGRKTKNDRWRQSKNVKNYIDRGLGKCFQVQLN